MKVYFYDKDTFEYKRTGEAYIDPEETKSEGKDVYALPQYATFIKVPSLKPYEVAVFDKEKQLWHVRKSFVGSYKLNTNTGAITKITENGALRTFERLIAKEVYEDYIKNPIKYAIIGNELVNISNTQQYQNLYNVRLYEAKILEAKEEYDKFMNTPVTFKGYEYLPRYVDDYATLINRSFPQEIWDYEGLKSRIMNKSEFIELKEFLENLVNSAYKKKKEAIKKYKLAIKKAEG